MGFTNSECGRRNKKLKPSRKTQIARPFEFGFPIENTKSKTRNPKHTSLTIDLPQAKHLKP
jgi:hypothetical protein